MKKAAAVAERARQFTWRVGERKVAVFRHAAKHNAHVTTFDSINLIAAIEELENRLRTKRHDRALLALCKQ